MPRYQYRCTDCEEVSTIDHPSDELCTICPKCDAERGLVKLLTRFSTGKKSVVKKRVGATTEEFIKDSRKALRQQRDDLDKGR